MAWGLSSWSLFVRIWQLLAATAAAGMNGFLTARVWKEKLGLTQTMVIIQLLICILLVYTTLALFVQHTGGRSKRKGWLIAFIVFDVLFVALDLGIVTLLSRAGLPDHCKGLTKRDSDDGMWPEPAVSGGHSPPISIPGFSDESIDGVEGSLDKFCGYERSFFVIAMAVVFTYILTIVLASLGVYETSHTKNTKVNEVLDALERAREDTVDLKLLDSGSSSQAQTTRTSLMSPPSEGIITRTASLRSTLTSFTASTTSHRPSAITRRPVPQSRRDHPPLPTQQQPSSPSRSSANLSSGAGFVPVPLDEESAEAALVTDGMNHMPSQQRSPLPSQIHRRAGSSSQSPHHHQQGMPMLLEEEQSAESALVSDGMRPEPMLPPYEPPRGRQMRGHGDEDNDMRLSEYVKGGTRAQEMKDGGGY
ncbi:hypothetical protein QBC34DRAFT_177552 [Podospora aff. communis PSN243]|uniref:MARVEL domain-containing protein n=1 Tax=Podospora aff. communis PSN243 TaxID=3040156 RepID=A0AAV9H262_9PEZI|nr:hypothetical protein QBC34DRAFT_177552 [Podospora aff. communis PSN243]